MKKGLSRKNKIGLYTFLAAVGVAVVGALGFGNKQKPKEETKPVKPTVEQVAIKADTVRSVYDVRNSGYFTKEPQTIQELEAAIRLQDEWLENEEAILNSSNLNPEERLEAKRAKRSIVIRRARYKQQLEELRKVQQQPRKNVGRQGR